MSLSDATPHLSQEANSAAEVTGRYTAAPGSRTVGLGEQLQTRTDFALDFQFHRNVASTLRCSENPNLAESQITPYPKVKGNS